MDPRVQGYLRAALMYLLYTLAFLGASAVWFYAPGWWVLLTLIFAAKYALQCGICLSRAARLHNS